MNGLFPPTACIVHNINMCMLISMSAVFVCACDVVLNINKPESNVFIDYLLGINYLKYQSQI